MKALQCKDPAKITEPAVSSSACFAYKVVPHVLTLLEHCNAPVELRRRMNTARY